MRRWRTVVASILGVTLGLAGCSAPPTVGDGRLGVDWAVLPTPSVPTPGEGVCTTAEGTHTAGPTLDFLPGTVVDCAQPHLTETVYVGVFPPEVDTDPDTVPMVGGARFRYAYTACQEAAIEFLSGEPYASRLAVLPVMPSERQWAGRARWFRCEVMELAGLDRTIVARTGSLREALAEDGPLTTTCADVRFNEARTEVLAATFVPCEDEHDVELTGVIALPEGDYPEVDRLIKLVDEGCRKVTSGYIGISDDALLPVGSDTFQFASPISGEMWSAGERTVWCFYGSLAERRTGSVRGREAFPY